MLLVILELIEEKYPGISTSQVFMIMIVEKLRK